ncbi:MAG: dynamin family protein, partial [Heliobacteriaceae bacterium]|nr:dynamin family protein [Heliobacteriaceae bacterium]
MSTVTLLEGRLPRIAAAFHQAQDEQSRQGIDTLLAKLTQNQLSVAFCGHISSGKSALINTLVGADLLPTAPLPTSANIVTLRPGAAAARVFPQEGHPVDLELPGALNRIQSCCQDRNETRTVAISYPYDLFGLPVTLVDTPGIDSAGMAERLVQDPAVLAADIVYYVMDYNHVQSELNFAVTKRLKERGKPVFLVINQIDKHCDFELDFAYFKHSSQAQFSAWNIRPDGLYFTTLTEPRHPENQLALLKRHLPALFQYGDQVLTTTVLAAARQLITDHCQRQAAKTAARRHQAQAVIDRYPDPTAAIREFQEIQQQRQTVESMPEQLETTLEKEINAVVQNAHITSYTTVELAARYIQSRTTGFRAGLLFAARKTEKERENRLQALFSNFSEKVHTNLEWHLRDILGKIPERFGLVDDTYLQTVNAFSVTWDAGLIAGSVCHEPVPSREYIHNFTDDIAAATKALYRRAALTVARQAVELAREHCRPQVDQLT